jgi:hypothetical protein
MSLREAELARSERARRSHSKQHKRTKQRTKRASSLDAPLSMLLDTQVMRFREWCRLNQFSERTGRRILASGNGPAVVQLTSKIIGVTVAADRAWKASRVRGGDVGARRRSRRGNEKARPNLRGPGAPGAF